MMTQAADMAMDPAPSAKAERRVATRRGKGIRFSLLTLVLGLLLISAVGLLFWSHADLRRLQAENAELKEKAGVLSISDPWKIHLVRLPIASNSEWRWNIYVPPGKYAVIRVMERVDSDEKWKPQEVWNFPVSSSDSESFGVRIDRNRGKVIVEDPFGVMNELALPETYESWLKTGNYAFELMSAGKTVPVSGTNNALMVQLQVSDPTAKLQLLPERSASGFQILVEEHDAPTTK
jgi:hypothetical protein